MLGTAIGDANALSPGLVCIAALVSATVGSVLPLSPTEPLLLALAALAPPELALPIAALATVGHMLGKMVVYVGSRRAEVVLSARHQQAVERARAHMQRTPALQSLTLLVSAVTGIPPFYGVTVLSGALRVPVLRFVVLGLVGRGARFVALVLLPGVRTW